MALLLRVSYFLIFFHFDAILVFKRYLLLGSFIFVFAVLIFFYLLCIVQSYLDKIIGYINLVNNFKKNA